MVRGKLNKCKLVIGVLIVALVLVAVVMRNPQC